MATKIAAERYFEIDFIFSEIKSDLSGKIVYKY